MLPNSPAEFSTLFLPEFVWVEPGRSEYRVRVWQIQLDPNTHYRPAPYRGDRPPCELSNITSVILNPATPYLYGIDRGLSLIEDLLVLAKEGRVSVRWRS